MTETQLVGIGGRLAGANRQFELGPAFDAVGRERRRFRAPFAGIFLRNSRRKLRGREACDRKIVRFCVSDFSDSAQ